MDIKSIIASLVETIIKVAVAIFLVTFVYDKAVQAYDFGYRVFAEEPVSYGEGRTISIYVEEDESVRDIGRNLQEKGLIRDANLFFVQELLSEYHGKIKPGIYDLNTSMKSDEMLEIMAAEAEEEEEEEPAASSDNVPIGETGDNGDGDIQGADDADSAGDTEGAQDTGSTGDAEGTQDTAGADGGEAESPEE